MTKEPEPTGASDKCRNASVRQGFVVVDRRRILRQVLAVIAVRDDQTSGDTGERHKPLGIGEAKPRGARPDLFLVCQKIISKLRKIVPRSSKGLRVLFAPNGFGFLFTHLCVSLYRDRFVLFFVSLRV